jgi:hypothetical protein
MGVIISIDKEKLSLDVSFKEEHTSHDESWWLHERYSNDFMTTWWNASTRAHTSFDTYFNEHLALTTYSESVSTPIEETNNGISALAPVPMTMNRLIYHPFFQNISFKEAEEYLRTIGDIGHAVFRPSSKVSACVVISTVHSSYIVVHRCSYLTSKILHLKLYNTTTIYCIYM